MVQELVVVYWCDVCPSSARVESKFHQVLTADGLTRQLDLCATHQSQAVPLDELAAFLERYGTDAAPALAPRSQRPTSGEKVRNHVCSVCGSAYTHLNSLRAHARKVHDLSVNEVARTAFGDTPQRRERTPVACDICGRSTGGPQGLGAHKKHAHGIPGRAIREAQAAQELEAASG